MDQLVEVQPQSQSFWYQVLVIRFVSTSSQLVVLPAVHGTMFSEAWGTPQAAWINHV